MDLFTHSGPVVTIIKIYTQNELPAPVAASFSSRGLSPISESFLEVIFDSYCKSPEMLMLIRVCRSLTKSFMYARARVRIRVYRNLTKLN